MKRISISVLSSASYCQSALMSQESTRRDGASQTSTLPQSHVLPSSPRSYHRPPAFGSITASTEFALPILYIVRGHHAPICSVKTRHATFCGARTVIVLHTLLASPIASFLKFSCVWLPRSQPRP